MAKIEIRSVHSEDCNRDINVLFVNDQMFDYLIDEDSLRSAAIYCNQNPHLTKAVHGDILKHFAISFSEFAGTVVESCRGKEFNLEEILEAIRKGEIDERIDK